MIGNVVGSYKVVEKIGEGGMGAVYKGIDLMLEREVAIKVLKPELASQPQVVERFRSEAVTLAKLNHPNIATLFSFLRQGDYFFMVLEYVKGVPLDKIIEANGVMTCEQAIPFFGQMLEGIDHAHSFGIIHRDIKPANMMLTENGLLKVLDFGIARALGSARMTRAGHLIGTIEYMSPEQVRGMETDARSDIYSLGMVLYEMLTGRVPFASDSEFELMKAQVEQLPRPPREFAPNIPEQVEWAILCATEKDPEKRFQTAGAFSEAIIDCVKTAIATGELSQMDMRTPTSRLSAGMVVTDLLTSRVSVERSPVVSHVSAPLSLETDGNQQRLPPPATRMAQGPGTLPQFPDASRMTRLAPPVNNQTFAAVNLPLVSEYARSSASLFDRLSWKHYLAGAAALVSLLAVLIVPLVLFLSRGTNTTEEIEQPAPANSQSSQQNPTEQIEPVDSSPPSTSQENRRDQSVPSNEPVIEGQDRNSVAASPAETGPTKKTGKASGPPRAKPRRGAKQIMEGP